MSTLKNLGPLPDTKYVDNKFVYNKFNFNYLRNIKSYFNIKYHEFKIYYLIKKQ